MDQDIAKKLKTIRSWFEMDQSQLSQRIGRSVTTISSWEKGKSYPSRDSIDAIENGLNIRLNSVQLIYEPANGHIN